MVSRVGESQLTGVRGFQRVVNGSGDEEVMHQFLRVVV